MNRNKRDICAHYHTVIVNGEEKQVACTNQAVYTCAFSMCCTEFGGAERFCLEHKKKDVWAITFFQHMFASEGGDIDDNDDRALCQFHYAEAQARI